MDTIQDLRERWERFQERLYTMNFEPVLIIMAALFVCHTIMFAVELYWVKNNLNMEGSLSNVGIMKEYYAMLKARNITPG